MKYMGSKAKYAKEFLPIVLRDRGNRTYVEPFVGGCNVIDKVDGHRIAGDNNRYIIELWTGLQMQKITTHPIPFDLYCRARDEYNTGGGTMSWFEIAWIGWMASYNGRFFDGGYSGGYEKRDYIGEQIRNTIRQVPFIKGVQFHHCDYSALPIFDKSIIYCDPPYKGVTGYSTSSKFDYDKFWEWCRQKSREGHKVFISEYDAPDDFQVLWQKEVKRTMHNTRTIIGSEKLFTYS
jgi:DNA adenine methylase